MNSRSKNTEDLLAALIMLRLEVTKYEKDAAYRSFINRLIEVKLVGGFCIFGGTIESLPIVLDELQILAKKSGMPPLLMSCDCEWGLPMRLHSGGTEFPHLMAIQRVGNQKGIKEVAQAIGIEMSALGLHWNFAPVADINSNPKNPIINIRAFSGDPETVAQCAQSFYEGLEYAGIISTAKHFPGHGDTHIDSHNDLPIIEKSAQEFEAIELLPFKHLAANGIPSIMTGHIAAPKLARNLGASEEEKNIPATISPYLTKKLLRERMKYEGVIITDSLEMYGLQKIVSDPAEIAVRAFSAGADILLMPTDPVAAYNGLRLAFEQGRISTQSAEESNIRIEKLRNRYVYGKNPKIEVKWLEHQETAYSAAKKSLTLDGIIAKPLSPSSVIVIASGTESEKQQRDMLSNFFAAEFPGIDLLLYTSKNIVKNIMWGGKPLILILHRPRGALTEEAGIGSVLQTTSEIVSTLITKNIHPAGVICLGDPYIAEEFIGTEPDFILKTYSDSIPSLRAALQLLKEHN